MAESAHVEDDPPELVAAYLNCGWVPDRMPSLPREDAPCPFCVGQLSHVRVTGGGG